METTGTFAKLGKQLSNEALRAASIAKNKQAGFDVVKFNEALASQIKQENNLMIGSYVQLQDDLKKMIKSKKDEKEFFEFKIDKVKVNDPRFIEYEKEIFNIEKEITLCEEEIEKYNIEINKLKELNT